MAIMLNPSFNALQIVKSLVGHGSVIRLAFEYDACKVVIPFLIMCFERLNLNTIAYATTIDDARLELGKNMFGMGASIEESFRTLVTRELFLFIFSFACGNPLTWWCIHEGQFLNVGSLAKQILGIPSSQIETEWDFSLVGC